MLADWGFFCDNWEAGDQEKRDCQIQPGLRARGNQVVHENHGGMVLEYRFSLVLCVYLLKVIEKMMIIILRGLV